jgi:hypothetical protein
MVATLITAFIVLLRVLVFIVVMAVFKEMIRWIIIHLRTITTITITITITSGACAVWLMCPRGRGVRARAPSCRRSLSSRAIIFIHRE